MNKQNIIYNITRVLLLAIAISGLGVTKAFSQANFPIDTLSELVTTLGENNTQRISIHDLLTTTRGRSPSEAFYRGILRLLGALFGEADLICNGDFIAASEWNNDFTMLNFTFENDFLSNRDYLNAAIGMLQTYQERLLSELRYLEDHPLIGNLGYIISVLQANSNANQQGSTSTTNSSSSSSSDDEEEEEKEKEKNHSQHNSTTNNSRLTTSLHTNIPIISLGSLSFDQQNFHIIATGDYGTNNHSSINNNINYNTRTPEFSDDESEERLPRAEFTLAELLAFILDEDNQSLLPITTRIRVSKTVAVALIADVLGIAQEEVDLEVVTDPITQNTQITLFSHTLSEVQTAIQTKCISLKIALKFLREKALFISDSGCFVSPNNFQPDLWTGGTRNNQHNLNLQSGDTIFLNHLFRFSNAYFTFWWHKTEHGGYFELTQGTADIEETAVEETAADETDDDDDSTTSVSLLGSIAGYLGFGNK